MKNKIRNVIKIITLLLSCLIIINCTYPIIINAADGGFVDFNEFESNDKTPENVKKLVNNTTGTAVSILRIAGIAIAVTMLLVIAMRYMISAPSDRADIKKHAIAYVIGAFILFGVTGILGILIDFSNSIGS